MCDYCSCRSMPVIDTLGQDHELLGTLASAVRRHLASGDEAAAHARFDKLVRLLRTHTALEEATVFAALRGEGEMSEQVDELLGDHHGAWAAVDALDTAPAWGPAALLFLDDLRDHVTREECDLFPATLVALSAAGWDAVEAAAGPFERG